MDRIPVPPLLRRVVEILERASDATRSQTGEEWLFEILMKENGERSKLNLRFHELLNDFAQIKDLTVPEGWGRWVLKAHQLRRGFAVAYYHGFQHASLDALSRFLRHFDPEMTRIYVNEIVAGSMGRLREEIGARTKETRSSMSAEDRRWLRDSRKLLNDLVERGETFNEVRCEYLVQRMLSIWDGDETPIGQGAKRIYDDLNSMVAQAAAEVRIGSRSNNPDALRKPLIAFLQDYAKTHYLEPVPGGAAHCTCRTDNEEDIAKAECLVVKAGNRTPWKQSAGAPDIRPDYAFSSCYICLKCQHCAVFSENKQVIDKKVVGLEDVAIRAASPAVKEGAAEKLSRMKAAVADARRVTEGRIR